MGMILKSGVGAYANMFVFLIVGAYFGSNCPQSFSQNTAVREPVSSPQAIQSPAIIYRRPIIDVHLHTDPPISAMGVPNPVTGSKPAATPTELRDSVIEQCKRYNIVRGVLNGYPGTLKSWVDKDPKRFISAPMILEQDKHPVIDVATLRQELREGRAGALGEIISQYVGLEPNDPALEPYWALAEELGVPTMIHTGTSFPGTPYFGYPAFRLRLGNPLLLEDVLVKHPKLRLWIAHGGEPWTEETFALMAEYPQIYMDVSTINWIGGPAGRPAFHAFLKQAIDRGLETRIMFGSDQMGWPDAIGLAIAGVDSAPFLTSDQKHDIFYGNATTFFLLRDQD
jgi:predicted TIM-barrel fold metal-dependent hydrolase